MKLLIAIVAATSLCAQGIVVVTGKITDSITGLPIEQASIALDQGSFHELVFTDASGNFVFDDVPPGTAAVKIRKGNYIPFETTNPGDVSIEITPDRHERNFKLTPAGKIRGHITGDGKPGEGIAAGLLKEDYSAGFRQYVSWVPVSDVLGQEGYFEMTGLEPGRYIVRATAALAAATAGEVFCLMQSGGSVCGTPDSGATKGPEEGYAVTWYPGTTTLADASPILLSAGETQTADFKMARQPLFHISGKVTLPKAEDQIAALALWSNGQGLALAMENDDGTFWFRGVPPGQYTVRAIFALSGQKYQIRRDIAVTDHDVEGIAVVPQPELHISGQFRMAREDTKLPASLAVQFGPPLPADSAPVEVAGSGTFTFTGFPDDYSVQPVAPAGYTITEILYAGINYLNSLVPIHGDTADPTITIVVSNQPATVGGSIDGDEKADAKIVLAPWPLPGNFDLRSLRVAVTDKQGAFSFQGLPPGKYKAAVLTSDDRKRDHDLTILNDKFSAADAFELTAGQSLAISPRP